MRTNDRSLTLARVAIAILFLASTASVASAQVRQAPKLDAAVAAAGTDEVLRLDLSQVTVRESDPLWNGALIGAGVAVASGLFLCTRTEPWANCRDDVGPMVRIGAIGAGIGIAIDALIRERRTIYQSADGSRRVVAAPIIGRRGAGMRVSLSF